MQSGAYPASLFRENNMKLQRRLELLCAEALRIHPVLLKIRTKS